MLLDRGVQRNSKGEGSETEGRGVNIEKNQLFMRNP